VPITKPEKKTQIQHKNSTNAQKQNKNKMAGENINNVAVNNNNYYNYYFIEIVVVSLFVQCSVSVSRNVKWHDVG
jgi:hypothetical protein